MERIEFLEQLRQLKEYADTKGQVLEKTEVMQFFQGMELTEEQGEMIFDYVKVKKEKTPELTDEEKKWLQQYRRNLAEEAADAGMQKWLKLVINIATEYAGRGLPLEDLVQEGNTGMVIALSDKTGSEVTAEEMEAKIRRNIRLALEEQEEAKVSDEKMAGKVNDLVERIKQLTEELGYKPSIDEVSHYLDMKAEEIRDLLYLAGEEVETEEPEEEEDAEVEHVHVHGEEGEPSHEHGEDCNCGHHHEH